MKSVYKNASRFTSLYGGLMLKLFRFAPSKTVAVASFQILGPILMPFIVLIIHKGIRLIQGGPVKSKFLPKSVLEWFSPVDLLIVLSLAIVLIGVLGALCGWLGAAGARRLGRFYRLHLAESLMNRIANSPLGSIRLPMGMASDSRLHIVTVTQGLKLNLAVISLFTAIRHAASALFLAASLAFVDPFLALVFFGATLFILPLYYFLNKRTHMASRSWSIEGGAKEASKSLMALGSEANALPEGREGQEGGQNFSPLVRQNSAIIDNLESMEFGRLSGARSQLYGNVFRALFLGGALFLFGLSALKPGHLSWDSLVVFLVGASMLQVSVTSLFNSVSALVWHSPAVAMILDYEKILGEGNKSRGKVLAKRDFKGNPFDGRKTGLVLVVSPNEIVRTNFVAFVEVMRRAGILSTEPSEVDFRAPRLKGQPLPVWKERLDACAPGPELTLIDVGTQGKEEKAMAVAEAGFSLAVVRCNSWEDSVEQFDYILKLDSDGTAEGGGSDYWRDRRDLSTFKSDGGMDLDLDLEMEMELEG